MSTLVAIAYPDDETAEKVRQELIQATKELGAKMPPGGAALIALGQTEARDKLLERIQPYGGHVLQTSLSNEDEERLRSALEGASA